MKVMVVGGGGREHAICLSLKKNNRIKELFCIPGNGGISEIATCIDIKATDLENIVKFATENKIDFAVVAPDDPLAMGLVDKLESVGIKAFGPRANAAIIEASKAFSKDLMKKYNIPTAEYETFEDIDKAINYLGKCSFPIVLKADGLALGKGVLICENYESAKDGLFEIMKDKKFGTAGNKVVIEEFLIGKEVSVLAWTDSKVVIPMLASQDHKKAYDNDKGLNTGGMGVFAPSQAYTEEMSKVAYETIFLPTINALNSEGRPFKGILYFGLMITDKGIKVLEYNARFGDPETQALLPLLKTDLLEIFEAIIDEKLENIKIEWEDNACVTVVLASGGYPLDYEKHLKIDIGNIDEDIILYHAATKKENGSYYTNGGRVLNVTAKGETIEAAREKAYRNIKNISFKNMHYRTDIGIKL